MIAHYYLADPAAITGQSNQLQASILTVARADDVVDKMFDSVKTRKGEKFRIAVSRDGYARFQRIDRDNRVLCSYQSIRGLYGYGKDDRLSGAFIRLLQIFADQVPDELIELIRYGAEPASDLLIVEVN